MAATWAVDEMQSADLNDRRLNARLIEVVSQLGSRPTASIPAACGGHAEMTAAYRFFDNDKVGFADVLQPHIERSHQRMAERPVVILVQDTTEIDVTRPEQQVQGAGTLDGSARYGGLLHPLVAFTPDGTPLGTVAAEFWTREDAEESTAPRDRAEQDALRKRTPIEDKESVRWVEGVQAAVNVAEEIPETQFVCVGDSESDVYEVLEQAQRQQAGLDWIVRAGQDRALVKPPETGGNDVDEAADDPSLTRLRACVLASDVLLEHTISVRGRQPKLPGDTRARRQPRQSRTAQMEVRATRVTLRPPWRPDRQLAETTVNVVLATEIDPPEGDVPIEWMLLTSLPVDTAAAVRLVILYYCVRWMIEVFFRTLKTGCRVEDRLFEQMGRLENCLAIYLIVTWRTLMVCRLGREFPDVSCEAVFEPAEWNAVFSVVHQQAPPATAPTLREMIHLVARLGGYVHRKSSPDPGPQTVWLGLQRCHDMAACWIAFGPETRNRSILV